MDLIDKLTQEATSVFTTACELNQLYDAHFKTSQSIGAIVFDNLRVNEDELRGQLERAPSPNKKLCCILNAFQNEIITLKDFIASALHTTIKRDIAVKMENLLALLSSMLGLIARMRLKLNDTQIPVSMYTHTLEKDMTSLVMTYLHKTTESEFVCAVRNYAIVFEVIVCAKLLTSYIKRL